ncbi:unnamed protein product [Paramecium primaurelia]|uniref:Tetratricopeptide repeat protein n=1 Tax=Paramecium primaurelia TaxID=5886 RepID=A0A8S1NP50_PARPR|nr:unnamed protein product [Paramecium primaurelia]
MDTNLTNSEVKFSYVEQNDIKIKKINDESEDKNQQNIKNSGRLFNEGLVFSIHLFCFRVVKNLNKFQETIECYEKAIFINPKNENAWNNKGNALYNLNKYQEAIECYDKVISINSKHDNTWSNKGKLYQNSGFALHNFEKYVEAISCYNVALSIKINPLRLQLKGIQVFSLNITDSLKRLNKNFEIFQIWKISEAKKFYEAALKQGSNDKNYINKKLSKL